jgi:hypothetical protein
VNSAIVLASLTIVGYSAWYALMCSAFPFGNCRRCKGTGRSYGPLSRRIFRLCSRCDGTGRRVRIGRRVYEYLRGEYQIGTGPDRKRGQQ